MSLPILYSFRRCPYAIRARMALHYSGQVCELREVVLKAKPLELLAASAKGTVPVLVLEDTVIDESLDLMTWAVAQNDPDNWSAVNAQHALVKRNDEYFTYWLNRYKYADRYPEASQHSYFDKCVAFLQELENALVANKNRELFLVSPTVNFVDVAIFPFVRQFAAVDMNRFIALSMPKLIVWHDYFLTAPLFTDVMQKYPMWAPTQIDIVEFGKT